MSFVKYMYALVCFLMLQMIVLQQLFAQHSGYEPTFLSPNAAGLSKYDQSSVNGYSGQINLSIPIWNEASTRVGLNLSLGYNSGGNKVEDIASWVGLGWSISGIPLITRQIRGLPDEGPFGIMGRYEGFTIEHFINIFEQSSEYKNFKINTGSGMVDTEADVFYLSINGFSGRFFYNQATNKFLTEEMTNIKINFDSNSKSFFVIDDQGTQYTFSVQETSQLDGSVSGKVTENTWLSTKIENATKTSNIQIQYALENQISFRIGEHVKYIQFGPYFTAALNDDYPFLTSIVKAYLPSVITFDGGKVKFIRNTVEREDLIGGYNLQKIIVSDHADAVISQNEFKYSYKSGAGSTTYRSNKWMLLDSVNVSGKVGSEKQTYRFAYDLSGFPPSRVSYAQDWWGYFNGAITNANLIGPSLISNPFQIAKLKLNGANRLVNELYSQFGILKKVNYPTGGFSEYFYENHDTGDMDVTADYDKQSLSVSTEEMWQDPEPVFPDHKIFTANFTINNGYDLFLNNNPNGGAILAANVMGLGVPPGTTGASIRIRGLSPSNSTVSHLFYDNFNNIYFPNGDYEIKAEFNQSPPKYMDFLCELTWYTKKSLTVNKLGGLRIRETKDYSALGKVAFSKKYHYSFDRFGEKSSGRLFGGNNLNNVMDLIRRVNSDGIIANSYYAKLSASPSTQSTSQNSTFVGYDRIYELMTSNSDTTLIKYDYINLPDENSYDFPYSPAQSFAVQNGKINQETIYRLKNNVLDSIQKTINNYDLGFGERKFFNLRRVDDDRNYGGVISLDGSLTYPGYYPYTFEQLKCNLLDKIMISYFAGVGYTQSHIVNNYTISGDLIQSDQYQSGGKVTRYKYIYPTGFTFSGVNETARLWLVTNNVVKNPIITRQYEVSGTVEKLLEEKALYYKQFGALNQSVFLEKVETKKMTALSNRIIFLTYDAYGNPLEIKKQEAPITVYLWGYGGKYPIAEIKNATYADVLAVLTQTTINSLNAVDVTETTINNAMSALRNHVSLNKAMVTSYTYKPLVGMTSKTDPRGVTEYYEYDGMQRLKAVLDQMKNVTSSMDYHYRPN